MKRLFAFALTLSLLSSNALTFPQRQRVFSLRLRSTQLMMENTGLRVSDLAGISVKDSLRACCGAVDIASKDILTTCEVVKAPPTICKFIIANPKAFFDNKDIARFHGLDVDAFNSSTPLSRLAMHLPVIYIAGRKPLGHLFLPYIILVYRQSTSFVISPTYISQMFIRSMEHSAFF